MNNKIAFALILGGGIIALIVFFVFRTLVNDGPRPTPREATGKSGTLIVAFGDSLTAGYGIPLTESYPAQLEARLKEKGYSVTVVNAGVSGETTRGNLERALFIRNQNPDIVLLGIGGNDALRLLPFEETEKNMRETITTLQSGDVVPQIVLLQMQAPLTSGLGYKQKFDALYETLSEEYNLMLVPFYTREVFLNPEYKLDDGIHFNKAGYAFVVEEYLLEPLIDLLKK
jgi:acyl-CoA thioesterase-1